MKMNRMIGRPFLSKEKHNLGRELKRQQSFVEKRRSYWIGFPRHKVIIFVVIERLTCRILKNANFEHLEVEILQSSIPF